MSSATRTVQVAPDIEALQFAIKGTARLVGFVDGGETDILAAEASTYFMVTSLYVTQTDSAASVLGVGSRTTVPAAPFVALSTELVVPARGALILPFNPDGWFVTPINCSLVLDGSTTPLGGAYTVTVRKILVPTLHRDLLA